MADERYVSQGVLETDILLDQATLAVSQGVLETDILLDQATLAVSQVVLEIDILLDSGNIGQGKGHNVGPGSQGKKKSKMPPSIIWIGPDI